MKESSLEKKLVDGARKRGFWALKFVSPGNDGVPDRIVVGFGMTFFVELKTERRVISEVQRSQIRRLRKCGQEVFVLFGPESVSTFLVILDKIRNEKEARNAVQAP